MTQQCRSPMACAALAIVLALACVARAQNSLQPADPAVSDIDLLSNNLRRVEPGLRSTGEQTNLFLVRPIGGAGDAASAPNAVPVYYRLGDGFRARVDHMEYIVPVDSKTARRNITPVRDGFYLERFPANTVFELSPTPDMLGSAAPVDTTPIRTTPRIVMPFDAPRDVYAKPVSTPLIERADAADTQPLYHRAAEAALDRDPLDRFRAVPGADGRLDYHVSGRVHVQDDHRLDTRLDLRIDLRVNPLRDDRGE